MWFIPEVDLTLVQQAEWPWLCAKLSVLGITALLLSQSICNFLNDIFERKGIAAEGIELCVTLSL